MDWLEDDLSVDELNNLIKEAKRLVIQGYGYRRIAQKLRIADRTAQGLVRKFDIPKCFTYWEEIPGTKQPSIHVPKIEEKTIQLSPAQG